MTSPALTGKEDPIAAIITPYGRGGVGIIRMSGPGVRHMMGKIFKPEKPGRRLEPRKQTLGRITLPRSGSEIDQSLVTYFKKPRSYTGEDVIEIACHGSPVVLNAILETLAEMGARPAEPGEFTYRAYLNGRMDLLQAEAVNDIISAKTLFQTEIAYKQLDGALSSFCHDLMETLLDLIARAEASIDFSEENYRFFQENELVQSLKRTSNKISSILSTYKTGKLIKEGIVLAIIGRPNVGKSSLFNKILDDKRAIVTHIPGTTRDYLEDTIQMQGIPVILVDTAGLRQGRTAPEKEAVKKTKNIMGKARLILVMLDSSRHLGLKDREILKHTEKRNRLVLINKVDLPGKLNPSILNRLVNPEEMMEISLRTGRGVKRLKERIFQAILGHEILEKNMAYLTTLRQKTALAEAGRSIQKAIRTARKGLSEEFILLDLHQARSRIGELTGVTTVEDIYDRIFSSFCIGK